MATPSKDQLIEQLRDLRVEPPEGASSKQLQDLVKRVKALPVLPGAGRERPVRAPLPSSTAPPLVPARPLVSAPKIVFSNPSPTHLAIPFVGSPRAMAVAAVAPSLGPSDHDARPWDPMAGW